MLDSVCVMLDDQDMAEEWIVRVQGKEYGPADVDTLREWKNEGRLLAENEARKSSVDVWSTAGAIPGLFDLTPAAPSPLLPSLIKPVEPRHRSFSRILADTVQIYRKGVFGFVCLTLLVLVPSLLSQVASALIQRPAGSEPDLRVVAAAGFGFVMLVVSLVMWPVYVAGIQILTAEIAAGRRPALGTMLNDAVRFWPRIAALCIFVYGVFALLMMFGLIIAAIALAGASSLLLVLFALALLILQVWMFGRFFITVLFWQQFAVLENTGFAESLRDSRGLARTGRDLPWFQRPLWRGAFIASLWFAFVAAITLASNWATLHHYFAQVLTTQDPQALLRQLAEAQQARGFDLPALALNVLQRILQPLLGIGFVVLYLDSKKHFER